MKAIALGAKGNVRVSLDIPNILQGLPHLERQALRSNRGIGEKEITVVTAWSFIDDSSYSVDLQMSSQNAQTVCDALMLTDS